MGGTNCRREMSGAWYKENTGADNPGVLAAGMRLPECKIEIVLTEGCL